MSQFQTVYESLLIDYESMKRKRETKWESWRENKKEGEGEEKSDVLAAHQHCLFQALFFYSCVLVLQSLHQENLQEEQHQWEISPSRGGIQSFCINSGNVPSADCFLNFHGANAVKRVETSLENITDFHRGITQSHSFIFYWWEVHLWLQKKAESTVCFLESADLILFNLTFCNQVPITTLTMTNSWLTKVSVCREATF